MAPRSSRQHVVDVFYTSDVVALTGLSKHMVDYLCRHGLLTVAESQGGKGNKRKFSFIDIVLAKAIRDFLDAGVSVLSLRSSFEELGRLLHEDAARAIRDRRVVIRGAVPYLVQPNRPPADLLARGQLAFSFVLEIEDLWSKAARLQASRAIALGARVNRAARLRNERIA